MVPLKKNSMEWFIAFRYLLGRRRMSFISIITYTSIVGAFLGTLVLIVALAIANGFEKEVRDRIVGIFAHAKILQYLGKPIVDYEPLRQEILKNPAVIGASPYILGKIIIEHDHAHDGTMVMGIDPELEKSVTNIEKVIKYGTYSLDSMVSIKGNKLPAVLIGTGIADKLGVRQGAEVILISLIEVEGESNPVPKMLRCVVTGIFETGIFDYDIGLTYISLPTAQSLLSIHGVEGIQLKVNDIFKAGDIARKIRDDLGGYPYKSDDWLNQNKVFFQWINIEKLVIFLVISLICVIAAFNILSSLFMMIMEKRREIGILMAMGSSRHAVLRVFLFNGSLIGLIGSTAGTLVGVLICYVQWRYHIFPLPSDVYFISSVPIQVRWSHVLAVFLSANALCILASWLPAVQASRILPAEAIRYE
ncbi:MAG: FtsX-like permease family protein [Chitinivibrionales bacterium]|nr:FtsX-like permease family protein [Chitinivibrionales bacterium]